MMTYRIEYHFTNAGWLHQQEKRRKQRGNRPDNLPNAGSLAVQWDQRLAALGGLLDDLEQWCRVEKFLKTYI